MRQLRERSLGIERADGQRKLTNGLLVGAESHRDRPCRSSAKRHEPARSRHEMIRSKRLLHGNELRSCATG
jgi:hypothetical protein